MPSDVRLGLSVLVVKHDLDTLYAICDRVAVLSGRKILATAPVRELEHSSDPWLHEYLMGKRSRASGQSSRLGAAADEPLAGI